MSAFTEIIGLVTRVGPKVTLHQIGDRVGVGASSWACLECRQCKKGNEQYCARQLDTYGAKWPDTGYVTKGGYSSHIRIHEHYCFPVPEELPTTVAAPMMCAGLVSMALLLLRIPVLRVFGCSRMQHLRLRSR